MSSLRPLGGQHYDYVVYATGKNNVYSDYQDDIRKASQFMYDLRRANVGKVLLISSGAYTSMTKAYDAAKYEIEMIANRILGDRLCVARLFSFVGPHVPKYLGIMQLIQQGMSGGPVVVQSPKSIRSYMHEDDLGRYLGTILLEGKLDMYEVGGESRYFMSTIGKWIADICQCDYLEQDDGRSTWYAPNVGATRSAGLAESMTFHEAIRRTVDALTQAEQPIKLSTVT